MKWRNLLIIGMLLFTLAAFPWGVQQGEAVPVLNPAVDYSKPNYAYSPPLRKFVNSLPGIGSGARPVGSALGPNDLGQYLPVATADTTTFPGTDYYEIALVDFNERMHGDLPVAGTKLRGYVQEVNGVAVGTPHYLGPLILATTGKPVRIKFTNRIGTAALGNLFLPVDTSLMGAGMGPLTAGGQPCDPTLPNATCASYTQNRATLHLHGGIPPWISDGTALQWITPAGESTPYLKGASQQNVPDMWYDSTTKNVILSCAGQLTCGVANATTTPAGVATFYWPNQQSGRLMFYHDHAVGMTGIDVYAGEAAGYLVLDPVEEDALATAGVPGTVGSAPATTDLAHLIPLVIQDKTFVYDNSITTNPAGLKDPTRFTAVLDPLWDSVNWGAGGNLWFPHVYVPNQDPTDPLTGANPLGRWDYGPWFWPIFPASTPYPPALSHVPEAFMDTPVINGTAYPYLAVAPAKYRLRILNACNDRMVNLQFYVADSGYTTPATATATILNGAITGIALNTQGTGYTPLSSPMVHIVGGGGYGAWATATVNGLGNVASITLTNGGAGYTSAPTVTIGGDTEVKMVPAVPNAAIPFPPVWLTQTPGMTPDILDSRLSGVPDPTFRGPAMIQIGTEGGLLPGPALLPNTPVGYEQNKRNIVVLNVAEKTLFLAPAERADVIVDFTNFAGKKVILYNDAPAPVPASDPRNDFYTGNPDYSITGGANYQGGAPSTPPGYGPNTRTIMQFRVSGSGGTAPVDDYPAALLTALNTALPATFAQRSDKLIVPEPTVPAASGGYSATATYAKISDTSLTFTPVGGLGTIVKPLKSKAIQELFDPQGRMNATLGVELPFTTSLIQTTIPLGFADPVTETIAPNEVQLWKITHNGVDTHGIHFHLVNVQVINRVGWDGAIRPPDANELGWKDTVRMNPLEDIVVAMRAKVATYPFSVPDSIRPLNPSLPLGSTMGFMNIDPLTGNAPAVPVSNVMTNFGHEYTWHCHILGHEEDDMMRAFVLSSSGKSEILWRNTATGDVYVWFMEGVTHNGGGMIGNLNDPNWQIVGMGDLNNDGKSEILWRNASTGDIYVWYMNGLTHTGGAMIGNIPAPWVIVGLGDFNGDGKNDILWRNPATGDNYVWYMNGIIHTGGSMVGNIPAPWTIVGVGDFNGDGKPDILWRNPTTGDNYVWFMNGVTHTGGALTENLADPNWQIVGVGDFNYDVYPDILWRNSVTGANMVWLMNGTTHTGSANLDSLADTNWKIVGTD